MNQSERRRTIEKYHLSIHKFTTIPELSVAFDVSQNTIKNDLRELERLGATYCPNLNSKPQEWYAVQPSKSLEMSLELAFALKTIRKTVEESFPSQLFESISDVFDLANEFYFEKSKLNKTHKVVRFNKSIEGIDFSRHLTLKNISLDTLESVKSSIYSDSELKLVLTSEEKTLRNVSLSEDESNLYIRGQALGLAKEVEKIDCSNIVSAEEYEYMPPWGLKNAA